MSVDHQPLLSAVALSGRVLGALFYYPPDSPQASPLLAALAQPGWHDSWPAAQEALARLEEGLAQGQDAQMTRAWQRLFIGPDSLPSPPWGSVWLDKESVLFGDSLLALRQWLQRYGIQPQLHPNEPEDHIGALLLLAGWLAESGQQQRLEELLAWHLLPWSDAFLQRLQQHAAHPFWQALAQLAQLTLAGWRAQMLIPVTQKPLYFQ
ncbi:Tat proofreading chaperone DmsD [Erwinia sp. V71]|uniref:Tat proofreading chaperone DmsD n=1 Tax=Erwinia sp. V71 TaxID=3369424 RepID=UPI003F5ED966